MRANERCDDGNDIDSDACLNTCAPAVCGDGVIWDGRRAVMMETVLQRMAARTAAMRRSAGTGSSVVIWRLRTPGLRSVMTATKRARTDVRRSAWLRYAVMVGSTPTKPVTTGTELRQTAAQRVHRRPLRRWNPAARPGAWRAGLRVLR